MTQHKATNGRIALAALGTALLVGGGLSLTRAHAAGKPMTIATAPHGTITPWEAMKIANAKVHGQPIEANYGFEDGHWHYDVVIIKNHHINEIAVNAITGKCDPTETVTPEDEAKETIADLKAALGKP